MELYFVYVWDKHLLAEHSMYIATSVMKHGMHVVLYYHLLFYRTLTN